MNDVRKIDKTYNSNYLRAEYNFIQTSAQMAAKWEEFMEDGDRYNLQYRTSNDGKVRPEHAAMHGITFHLHTRSGRSSTHPMAGTADVMSFKYESQSTLLLTTRRRWLSENSPQARTSKVSSASIRAKRRSVCRTIIRTPSADAGTATLPRANSNWHLSRITNYVQLVRH